MFTFGVSVHTNCDSKLDSVKLSAAHRMNKGMPETKQLKM